MIIVCQDALDIDNIRGIFIVDMISRYIQLLQYTANSSHLTSSLVPG